MSFWLILAAVILFALSALGATIIQSQMTWGFVALSLGLLAERRP